MKMKASNLWYGLLCMLAVSVSLSSCSDDNGNTGRECKFIFL